MNFPIPFASTHHARAVDAALGAETDELLVVTRLASAQACQHLGSSENGLSAAEAEKRLAQYGPNLVTRERKPSIAQEIWNRTKNPLNALLLSLAIVSYALGDMRAAIVIAAMVILAISTAFIQEHRSNEAAARLRAMVKTTATVRRDADERDANGFLEVSLETLVPGDRLGGALGRESMDLVSCVVSDVRDALAGERLTLAVSGN